MSLFEASYVTQEDIEKIYTIKEELGRGTFSTVKLAASKKNPNQLFAMKIIKRSAVGDKVEMIQTEVDILRKVRHKHVITLHEIYETKTNIYLVMELVTGGELFDKIVEKGTYSEKDAAKLVNEILDALSYLHTMGIVHRDLKPENLLYANESADSDIKLADFGLSKVVGNDAMLKTACGTPGYVAPEVLKCEGYEKAVDLWSVGVITYILLCGFPPFYHENTPTLFELIMKGQYDFPSPYWDHISDSAKDLIEHLLVVDPSKRYTVQQALNHPWIAGNMASSKEIPNICEQLKKLNAKRKLKSGFLAALASTAFTKLVK